MTAPNVEVDRIDPSQYKTVAGLAAIFASPVRIAALVALDRNPSSPTSLADTLGMTIATVNAHLRTLKLAKLVDSERPQDDRRSVVYRVTGPGQLAVSALLGLTEATRS